MRKGFLNNVMQLPEGLPVDLGGIGIGDRPAADAAASFSATISAVHLDGFNRLLVFLRAGKSIVRITTMIAKVIMTAIRVVRMIIAMDISVPLIYGLAVK